MQSRKPHLLMVETGRAENIPELNIMNQPILQFEPETSPDRAFSQLEAQLSGKLQMLAGARQLQTRHRQVGQQPDNLCGPYWGALLLQTWANVPLDAAQLGQMAGTVLPLGESATWLPQGATSRQDYSVVLPQTHRLEESGTATAGLVQAVSEASQGRYSLLPLRCRWTAERVLAVLSLCQSESEAKRTVVPLMNLQTGHFWGSQITVPEAIAYLQGQPLLPPPADWDVGHFAVLAGVVQGAARCLLLVQDTYPLFGWEGYHLQPPEAIAAALNRSDGNEGGILLFTAAAHQAMLEQQCRQQGFDIALWDNGTP